MTPTLATTDACTCDACTALRDALSALTLPVSLVHDDGTPVIVAVGDTEITAAEAYLRLALTTDGVKDHPDIRRMIGRLRELDPTDVNFQHRYDEACKLVASLKLVEDDG